MTLYEFKLLDEVMQAETLWERGVYLADRASGLYRCILYQIDGFYVEVLYRFDYNEIRQLRSFSSLHQLEPYMNGISIEGLVE